VNHAVLSASEGDEAGEISRHGWYAWADALLLRRSVMLEEIEGDIARGHVVCFLERDSHQEENAGSSMTFAKSATLKPLFQVFPSLYQ
jgi:hypothetical protein